jgi:hypothetical protein
MKKNLTIPILILVVIGGVSFYLRHSVLILNPSDKNTTTTMKVKIALLGAQMETLNKNNFRGCDVFELVERDVPASSQALNAALRELFSKKDIWMPGELAPGNFIASQDELFFDKVSIENGIAKIYMLGKVKLAGACDNPRLRIQLEETSLQFPSVKSVEFYVDGIKNDLVFSEKGI